MPLNWPLKHSGTKIHRTQVTWKPLKSRGERSIYKEDWVPKPNVNAYRTDQSNSTWLEFPCSLLPLSLLYLDGLVPRLSNQTPWVRMNKYVYSFLSLILSICFKSSFRKTGLSFISWSPYLARSQINPSLYKNPVTSDSSFSVSNKQWTHQLCSVTSVGWFWGMFSTPFSYFHRSTLVWLEATYRAITHSDFTVFSSWPHFPTPQINYLYSNVCFKICFLGNKIKAYIILNHVEFTTY